MPPSADARRATIDPANRSMLAHAAAGIVLGFAVAAAIILFDMHGIGTLLKTSDKGVVAVVLLTAGFASLAAAGSFSTAMAWRAPPSCGRSGGTGSLAPAFVSARRQR
ncbi:hypothetical protein [uncultured Alsobacter sp.]|uniref:hypothetical protein n=1 Tax=uncultured Alsobacter sp. TaxID=1748258 RepID=UPI0025EAD5C6|nr:hypothetical protein [uncultured Alsobacter sp.]